MTIKDVKKINSLVVALQNHWAVFVLVSLVFVNITPEYTISILGLGTWVLPSMLPILFFGLHKFVKSKFFRFVLYVLAVGSLLLIPVPLQAYRIVYLSCGIYHALTFKTDMLEDDVLDKAIPIWVTFIMTFIAMLIMQYLRLYEYQRYFLYVLLINIFIFCVGSYVSKYANFLMLNRHSVGYIPTGNILFAGVKVMMRYGGILCCISVICITFGKMDDYFYRILEWIHSINRKLFKNVDQKKHDADWGVPEMEGGFGYIPDGADEGFNTWDLIAIIVFIVLSCIVLIQVLYVLRRLLKDFFGGILISRKKQVKETEENIVNCDVVEKLRKKTTESGFLFLSPTERIRRKYKKEVLLSQSLIKEEKKADNMGVYTARECAQVLEKPLMADIYEKARYSPYECTGNDVKAMKKACKK